jgi:putative SOS response-associated peptidase YedK
VCTNYRPGSRDFIRERLGVDADFDYLAETYPAYSAPIVLGAGSAKVCRPACFGLIPHWSRDTKIARSTYNARSETVAEKPSFRNAWRRRQFCLVPMRGFYEPNYESGSAVRWRIEPTSGEEFCVAGIWESWRAPTDAAVLSFSMLTINADGHGLMQRFHAPGDEKRSIVVVAPADYDAWLGADDAGARALLHAFDAGAFHAVADPRPRLPRASAR